MDAGELELGVQQRDSRASSVRKRSNAAVSFRAGSRWLTVAMRTRVASLATASGVGSLSIDPGDADMSARYPTTGAGQVVSVTLPPWTVAVSATGPSGLIARS